MLVLSPEALAVLQHQVERRMMAGLGDLDARHRGVVARFQHPQIGVVRERAIDPVLSARPGRARRRGNCAGSSVDRVLIGSPTKISSCSVVAPIACRALISSASRRS